MNKVKQWLVDVGFWATEIDAWSWSPRNFRLRFWRTPTNSTHRTYRAVISRLVSSHYAELQEAYHQGAKDGVLQYAEYLMQEEGETPPEQRYIN